MSMLTTIDISRPVTISAWRRGTSTDVQLLKLAQDQSMPELTNELRQIEGIPDLRIEDAAGFAAWLQGTRMCARVADDLQCLSEDSEGRRILTAFFPFSDFEELVNEAKGSAYAEMLNKALSEWSGQAPDEVDLSMYEQRR